MITYEYKCKGCAFHFEVEMSIHENLLTECPDCGEAALQQIFGTPFCLIYGEAKTIEHVSERNVKRIGRNELAQRQAIEKETRIKKIENMKVPQGGTVISPREAATPWFRKGIHGTPVSPKPIDLDKIKDVNKFIETGDKS